MPVVLGTAGHIDHGKTSLVKRLTGVDCDRLEEEKRRGITIELGFAQLELPENRRLSIIDVPGHERFVRNMVAGAAGIDFVMLVIAADEGVMPQTREHLEICSLLGIRTGLVALTKIDMVDADLLELAEDDVRSFLQGTFLENAPVFPVSAHTGAGIEALTAELARMEKSLAPERRSDLFRLPVDRVFTMRGHGTVVTGTMISGSIAVGDEVRLYPSGTASKVRSLQSHGEAVQVAPAGRRTAVNLQGLEVADVQRGDVLSRPDALFPVSRWILRVQCLPSSPRQLRHRGEIHFHHGTREVQARLYFFDRDALRPGETALCEARFAEPMCGVFGDACVIRSFSPLRTVAGGMVVHPFETTLRKRSPEYARKLELLETAAASADVLEEGALAPAEETRVLAVLELAGAAGISFAALCVAVNLESRRLDKLLQTLSSKGTAACFDKDERIFVAGAVEAALAEVCLQSFGTFHKENPMKPGLSRGAATSGWGKGLAPKLVHFILERLLRQGKLAADGDVLRLPGHRVTLASDQSALRSKILAAHREAGDAPPNMKDVLENLGVTTKEAAPVLKIMQDSGELVRVAEGIWYAGEALAGILEKVRQWFVGHDNLDVAALKEITGLSRKYLIALLEYFDREKITVRVGDKRLPRTGGA